MRFVLIPSDSLEHRALLKIAVTLWNQKDVRALIAKLSSQDDEPADDDDSSVIITHDDYSSPVDWKEIEEKVTEKVLHLSLPQLLREKVLGCIKPIGEQIYKWIDFHCIDCDLSLNLPLELCWTPQGMLDGKRIAEVLVKDESLDRVTRYKLACVYCLEDDIIALWNTLSGDIKQSFLGRNSPNTVEQGEELIIIVWSRSMKRGGLGNARTSYKDEFQLYARKDHKVALEYFLQKLTPQEREESLVEAAKHTYSADVLCFLLTEMDEEQQMEVFKDEPGRVLRCFLQWPWQGFFMEIANWLWDFLSKDDYEYTLIKIIDKVREGYKDCNYQKLFGEFWQKTPDALKSLITDEFDESSLLPALCRIKDEENIRLIFEDVTYTAREKFIYSHEMRNFCEFCIVSDKWDSLEFCIRECFPSKNLRLKFKQVFEQRIKWKLDFVKYKLVRNKDKWDRLFLSSDDSTREYNKRSTDDEGESSSSKRFRSLQ